ncbi:MAG: rRNA maturation RNase YbeY [Chitinispirillaceae bacterium]
MHDYTSLPVPRKLIEKTARAVYKDEHIPTKQRTILVLCSDYKIRKLNSQYRKKDKPTDVLSFPFGDPDLLGEIYISLQRARVQSKKYGLTYEQEIRRLFVHGLFHLLGHDHHEEAEREAMEFKEHRYLDLS